MKLNADDVHSLTIIAMDPHGEFAERLIHGLTGEALEVARGLRGERPLEDLDPSLRSAVEEFRNWANPVAA